MFPLENINLSTGNSMQWVHGGSFDSIDVTYCASSDHYARMSTATKRKVHAPVEFRRGDRIKKSWFDFTYFEIVEEEAKNTSGKKVSFVSHVVPWRRPPPRESKQTTPTGDPPFP
jgi:hypothetical protein